MESQHPLCIICGACVPYRHPTRTWRRNFRAIRCDNNSALDGKAFLTGVGSRVPSHMSCAAPCRTEARWNDQGYVVSEKDFFPPLIGDSEHPQPGFIGHESCWELLEMAMRPCPVPIQRLYDICLSCPARERGWLDWGHSYGGVMNLFPVIGYPWEDVSSVGYIRRYLTIADSPLSLLIGEPLEVPEIQQALAESQDRQTGETSVLVPSFSMNTADCFWKLPQEVLEYIQTFLPSSSVVNIRLASRSFASLPLTQTFWASRFDYCHERGFCLEAKDPFCSNLSAQRTRDWKMLYTMTAVTLDTSQQLKNRKRIWTYLKDLVNLILQQPLPNENLIREIQTAPLEPEMSWRSVGGDFGTYPRQRFPRRMKCRVIYEQVATLSSPIVSIGISFQGLNGKRYISGLQFAFVNGDKLRMGYVLPQMNQVSFHKGPFSISGFMIAAAPRGITAMRIVTTGGEISDWIGSAEDFPQSIRLCTKTTVSTIRGRFDGFKMISLAIPSDLEPLFALSARTTELWYPSIPARSLSLHSEPFTKTPISDHEYRPFIHVMFGGLRGDLLKYLTRISVTASNAAIVGIDFFYAENAPKSRIQACPSTASDDDSVKILFPIDGPGGERLTSLQANGDFLGVEDASRGRITSLKITTNIRPEAFTFQPSAIPRLTLPSRPVPRSKTRTAKTSPELTLTGLYFIYHSELAMVGVNPIYENLKLEGKFQETGIEEEIRSHLVKDNNTDVKDWK